MKHPAIIFDLDGTLLDSLADLAASVNHALQTHGMPTRSIAEVRTFVGNGVRHLMSEAVVPGTASSLFEQVFATFRHHYAEHCMDTTAPYPGIREMLTALQQRNIRTAIVSNKIHSAVEALHQRFFAESIDTAIGESSTIRRKPHPDGLQEAMRRLGSTPETTLYVGDSEVDILTAQRCGIRCITVLWGFRDEMFLRQQGAETCIREPQELLSLI